MSLESVEQAIRHESQAAVTDQTRSARVRRGVYSMRQKPHFYMLRTRIPAGLIRNDQLETLASIAEEVGWPLGIHLTTRQGIEIPGVPAEKVVPYLQRIEASGLTTALTGGNAVRGVVCCPLGGVTPDEIFDPTSYALGVDTYFRNHPDFQQMPRKIKLSFEGCREADHVRRLASDLGFQAARRDGVDGFHLVIGGGFGATPKVAQTLEEFVPVTELVATIEAILRVFNRYGNRQNRARARLKWLLDEKGLAWFRGEYDREKAALRDNAALSSSHWPVVAESLPTAQTVTGSEPDEPLYRVWKETNVHAQKQPGFVTVFVRVPNGDILPAALRDLASIAKQYAGSVRTSIEQNFILRYVAENTVPVLYAALKKSGLSACCAGELIDITRCAGADVCLSALTNSRAAARTIAEALKGDLARDPALKDLRIRVSGCPNSCSHHHTADIGLFGLSKNYHGRPVPHYALLLGGSVRTGQCATRIAEFPALQVGQAVKATLLYYRSNRTVDEVFTTFVKRIGAGVLAEKLAPLTKVPPPETAPSFYRDLEGEDSFRIAAQRGECAA